MPTTPGAPTRLGVALVHGAGLDGSIWDDVRERLDVPSVAVDLPHRGDPAATKGLTLDDYVTAAVDQAASLETERIVLVMHSIGGVVGLAGAEALGSRLAGLVAVSAAIPRPGGTFLSCLPRPKRLLLTAVLRVVGTRPPASAIRAGLANDLTSAQADRLVERFTPEARALYTTPVDYVLPEVPRRYVLTTDDAELDPEIQRQMAAHLGSGDLVQIKSGHLPMLGHPADVAEAISALTVAR